jgi:hypothetical protein
MPSSARLTVSTCRHAHRRSEPAAHQVYRGRRAGSPSRGLRIPCRFRACVAPTFPRQSSSLFRWSNLHDMLRLHPRRSVRNRAVGRLGNQVHRRSASVMIRRRSMCRTAMSTHVWPTSPVANETRQMTCRRTSMSTKANLMCVAPPRQRPPQGSAAQDHAAARLRRLRPCPGRRPAAVEMGLHEENGDPQARPRAQ